MAHTLLSPRWLPAFCLVAASALLTALPSTAASSPSTAPTTRPGTLPTWILGTWTSPSPRGRTEETWTADGNALVGSGKTFRGDKLAFTESLRIDRNPAGQLVYTATPQGQAPTPFTATEESATQLVFENPANDFPTKITYTLNPDGTLVAKISGLRNGKEASQTWNFTKSP